jgi:hypothetical protein
VPGQLRGGALDVPAREGGGVRGVAAYPLAGQQVGVDGLGEQRVPEGVAVLVHRDEHVVLHCGAQCVVQRQRVERDDRGQLGVRDPPSRARGGPDHVGGGLVQRVEPDQQQVGEVVGQPAARPGAHVIGAGAWVRRLGELLGEERVALGALDDHLQLALLQRTGV